MELGGDENQLSFEEKVAQSTGQALDVLATLVYNAGMSSVGFDVESEQATSSLASAFFTNPTETCSGGSSQTISCDSGSVKLETSCYYNQDDCQFQVGVTHLFEDCVDGSYQINGYLSGMLFLIPNNCDFVDAVGIAVNYEVFGTDLEIEDTSDLESETILLDTLSVEGFPTCGPDQPCPFDPNILDVFSESRVGDLICQHGTNIVNPSLGNDLSQLSTYVVSGICEKNNLNSEETSKDPILFKLPFGESNDDCVPATNFICDTDQDCVDQNEVNSTFQNWFCKENRCQKKPLVGSSGALEYSSTCQNCVVEPGEIGDFGELDEVPAETCTEDLEFDFELCQCL